jgi:hypothetical protein
MTAVYGVAAAAAVCGVSVRTIQRRSAALEAAGAWRDSRRRWQIPVTALTAVGLRPGGGDTVTVGYDMSYDTATFDADMAELRRRAEVAEARVAGLQAVIEAQAMALRQLEARPAPEAAPGPLRWVRKLF